jgi:hypothetical protein
MSTITRWTSADPESMPDDGKTFAETDIRESPVLPGFRCPVTSLFARIPRTSSGDN